MQLTRNFSLQELTKSDTAIRKGINNNPNAEQIEKEYKNKKLETQEPEIEPVSSLPTEDRSIQTVRLPNIQTPPLGDTPQPIVRPAQANVDPNTNLTRTQTALLSPEEQVIASRTT